MRLGEFIQTYGISSNTQLANFAKSIGLPLIEINFAEDITINSDGAYIINLGDLHIGGTHWTGLWIEANQAFYFDSYGVAPEDILIAKIQSYNSSIEISFNDGYEFQLFDEELCGMWVLMFFHFMIAGRPYESLDERFKKMTERYADTIS
jgi:hypothetical protein